MLGLEEVGNVGVRGRGVKLELGGDVIAVSFIARSVVCFKKTGIWRLCICLSVRVFLRVCVFVSVFVSMYV